VAGAAVVTVHDPHKTLGIDAVTFGLSAVIRLTGVRSRPAPGRAGAARASLWSVSADGVRIVPYARSLHGNALTVGLLMAAVPLGMVIGAFVTSRIAAPSARIRMMGWLAVLSCAPLIGSAWSPPLWAVLVLWTLAGAGGAYQLAAAAAFVQALRPDTRARAFGVAQSGLYAVQGLGILAGGALAQQIGAPLAMSWTHLRGRLIQAPNGPESPSPVG
jgi:MFS family permease